MSSRAVSNLILLGVIFILGGLVLYTQYREKPTPAPPLTDLKVDQIKQIRIERQEETVVLNKDSQGHWSLTAPLTIAAHAFRVDNLLRLLSTTHYQLVESNSILLADLKLEPPLVRVTFDDKWVVAFGDRSPLNDGQRYIQINQKVYLLLDTIYSSLTDDVTTFISLSPLGNAPKVTELKLPDTHLVLKEGFWHSLVVPPSVDHSADAISSLIENWQQAQAFTVKHYTDEGTTPQGNIEVTLQGQERPLNFIILATTPEFILALPEKRIQYHFSMNQVERLLYLPKQTVKDEVGHATTINSESE